MTAAGEAVAARAAALRAEFDDAFARPAAPVRGDTEALLAVGVGRDPYVVRVAQVAGLFVDRVVTGLPGGPAHQLGVTAFRRAVVPVFDLRVLLGRPGGDPPRWMLQTAGDPAVALAFDRFEGQFRVPRLAPTAEVVHLAGGARPIIDVPALLARVVPPQEASR